MSADNTVGILKTSNGIGGFEYRVAHIMAIDNLYYSSDPDLPFSGDERVNDPDILIENARKMWMMCQVFDNEKDAKEEAKKIEQELGYVEYGIEVIEIDREF
jgi:hypothetical protein